MQFTVPDMTCGGCAGAITRAVTRLDPAATLDVDVPVKTVRITSVLPAQQLIETIEAAGFHPSLRS